MSSEPSSKEAQKSKRPVRLKSVAISEEAASAHWIRALLLYIILAFPAFVFGVLFTAKGYGRVVVTSLAPYYDISRLVAAGGAGLVFLMYLLDMSYWKGIYKTLRTILLIIAGLTMVAGGVLMSGGTL